MTINRSNEDQFDISKYDPIEMKPMKDDEKVQPVKKIINLRTLQKREEVIEDG